MITECVSCAEALAFGAAQRELLKQLVDDGETRAATHATAAEKLTRDASGAFAQLRDAQRTAGLPPSDTRLIDSLLDAEVHLSAVRTRIVQPLAQAYRAACELCATRADAASVTQMREQLRAMGVSANEMLREERTPLREASVCLLLKTTRFVRTRTCSFSTRVHSLRTLRPSAPRATSNRDAVRPSAQQCAFSSTCCCSRTPRARLS